MSSNTPISLTVTHSGTPYSLSLLPDSTLTNLQLQLEELTSVPPLLQKLLYKGKKPSSGVQDETTLSQAGIKHGIKIQMLGSTTEQLRGLQTAESEQKKRDHILRERALKPPTKVSSLNAIATCHSANIRTDKAPIDGFIKRRLFEASISPTYAPTPPSQPRVCSCSVDETFRGFCHQAYNAEARVLRGGFDGTCATRASGVAGAKRQRGRSN